MNRVGDTIKWKGEREMRRILCIIAAVIFALASIFTISACDSITKKYTVTYETDGNGTIYGESVQTLESGEQTKAITVEPNEGYEFDRWSDGNTQLTRIDTVKDKDIKLTAYFKKASYHVTYSAYENGRVEGDLDQVVEYGGNATTVTAIPDIGYGFKYWNDTRDTNPVRTDTNVKRYIWGNAIFERTEFGKNTVTYITDGNGKIEGKASQQILYGEDTTTVKAIANDGFEFVKWSDGVTTAERNETCVIENKTLTAEFRCIYATFKLDYKLGETDSTVKEYTFYDSDFKTEQFPVPTRELFTFNGWYIGDKQVTDVDGTMVAGKEILQRKEREIYAKWTANVNYTYKILMVYVTELDAEIKSIKDYKYYPVYYKMTDFDIEICKTITKQVSRYFNDMMDGLVTFEVDEYFTTEPVRTESIRFLDTVNALYADDIPEIKDSGIYKNYESVLTLFHMDDYDYRFRDCAGIANIKYCNVFLETVYGETKLNNEPLENILDTNFWRWDKIIEPFMHELAHTIELQMYGAYEYHKVISWAHAQLMYDHILMNKLYYLNLLEIDGKKVGIPLEFWSGEM